MEGTIRTRLPGLFRLETVRERAEEVYQWVAKGQSRHWRLDIGRLGEAVAVTEALIAAREAGGGVIPYHSRFRHFEASQGLYPRYLDSLSGLPEDEQGRSLVELVIVSVLADAGAGALWRFTDIDGRSSSRSEGLAVGSLALYGSGLLSSVADNPLRVDADALGALSETAFSEAFQVYGTDNPMIGAEGRCALLRRLGNTLRSQPKFYYSAASGGYRLGYLYDYLKKKGAKGAVSMHEIFSALAESLLPCWPAHPDPVSGIVLNGDLWRHPALEARFPSDPYIPFHKLTQWLCYSLWEALERLGHAVTDAGILTGLPEYRNGGLFMDTGVLLLREGTDTAVSHQPGSELVIEWRALTVKLLDMTADAVNASRAEAGHRPLNHAQVLEGGTWAAGRKLAAQRRGAAAMPPLQVSSDGTLF